jgi:hypothetical protein
VELLVKEIFPELREAALVKSLLREEPCSCEVAGQPLVNERSPCRWRRSRRYREAA